MQAQALDSQEEFWVIQRQVYRRGSKSSWKTISPPLSYDEALSQMRKLPADTSRLMTGIAEYFSINCIQREV